MVAAFCLATLALTASTEAVAQGLPGSVIDQAYYNGYGAGYNSRYGSAYGSYGYTGYGSSRSGYTGYGNGPYGYRSPAPYGYPATGYGYSNGTYNSLYYRALRFTVGPTAPSTIPTLPGITVLTVAKDIDRSTGTGCKSM